MVGATCQPLYTAVPKENNVFRCSALFYILDNINIMYSQGKAYGKQTLSALCKCIRCDYRENNALKCSALFYELLLLCIVVYKAVGIISYNGKLIVVLTLSNMPRCKSYYVIKKPRSSACRKCHM